MGIFPGKWDEHGIFRDQYLPRRVVIFRKHLLIRHQHLPAPLPRRPAWPHWPPTLSSGKRLTPCRDGAGTDQTHIQPPVAQVA